jgi:hypothetical protein
MGRFAKIMGARQVADRQLSIGVKRAKDASPPKAVQKAVSQCAALLATLERRANNLKMRSYSLLSALPISEVADGRLECAVAINAARLP